MKGGLIQLVASGEEDVYLISNDDITFFKFKYKRYSNFAIENKEILFTNKPSFNSNSIIKLNKGGDLINKMYLKVDLPYDSSLDNTYWTNRIGFRLIKRVEFYVGNQLIDKLYGEWMHIWSELSLTNDKKKYLDNMIGTTGNNGINNGLKANVKNTLYIPLNFYFCNNFYSSFPIMSMLNKNVYMKFFFESKNNCIQSGTIPSGNLENVSLLVDYIFLDNIEKKRFVQEEREYVIEQIYKFEKNLSTASSKEFILPFNLPTKQFVWVNKSLSNNMDKFTNFTNNGEYNINNIQFKINGSNYFRSKPRESDYFNYIIPYYNHSGFPDKGINTLITCLNPEDLISSGYWNLRKIKKFSIRVSSNSKSLFTIYAKSFNIIKIKDGVLDLFYKF